MNTLDDEDLMIARGRFSTVRALHEDRKKDLCSLCGHLAACASQILRKMQPDNDDAPVSVADLFKAAKQTLDKIDTCVTDIEALAKQRAELKGPAWK